MADIDPQHSTSSEDEVGFFDRPETVQWILRFFYFICIVLVVVDFIVHRHIVTDIEKVPAFYAIYGFVACVVLVLIANQMRKVLMRDEHYYQNENNQNEGFDKGDKGNKSNKVNADD